MKILHRNMLDNLFFAAEIDSNISIVDLHEFTTIHEALEQLEKELFLLFNNGEKYIRVVYGIGTGRLAKAVHETLSKNPLVDSWKESNEGGSCIIIF